MTIGAENIALIQLPHESPDSSAASDFSGQVEHFLSRTTVVKHQYPPVYLSAFFADTPLSNFSEKQPARKTGVFHAY